MFSLKRTTKNESSSVIIREFKQSKHKFARDFIQLIIGSVKQKTKKSNMKVKASVLRKELVQDAGVLPEQTGQTHPGQK